MQTLIRHANEMKYNINENALKNAKTYYYRPLFHKKCIWNEF